MATKINIRTLLEAGCHFGHQTRRWNPKMAPYIYTERNGIYIVDLQKTVKKLEEAYNFVRQLSESGQSLLFVGTKKQAQEAIKEEALRCNMYYVNARWLGGMMTNFKTMRTRIDRLNQLKTMQADGTLTVKVSVKNTGAREGQEVVQLYISDKKSSLPRPVKELKGFQKVKLAPGETKEVTFTIDKEALSFFDDTQHAWVAEPGKFEAVIAASAADVKGTVPFELK